MTHSEMADAPGKTWMEIVRKHGTAEFDSAFAAAVVVEASVLNGAGHGIDFVRAFFRGTSGMYERIGFTYEMGDAVKTYLEWEGEAFGMPVSGSTTLTRNAAGLIESIRLHHRPLSMVVRFSAELGRRLHGQVDPALFDHGRSE